MLDKKHKMLVNKKVSNIRKHAKQGAEIPGYNKYLKNKKRSHSNYACCPNENVRFFLKPKTETCKTQI